MSSTYQALFEEYSRMVEAAKQYLSDTDIGTLEASLEIFDRRLSTGRGGVDEAGFGSARYRSGQWLQGSVAPDQTGGSWSRAQGGADHTGQLAGAGMGDSDLRAGSASGAGFGWGDTFHPEVGEAAASMDALFQARLIDAGAPAEWEAHTSKVMSILGRWPV